LVYSQNIFVLWKFWESRLASCMWGQCSCSSSIQHCSCSSKLFSVFGKSFPRSHLVRTRPAQNCQAAGYVNLNGYAVPGTSNILFTTRYYRLIKKITHPCTNYQTKIHCTRWIYRYILRSVTPAPDSAPGSLS